MNDAPPGFIAANQDELVAALAKLPDSALVVVDFDVTLFLQNSTELYIATMRPRIVAILVGKLLDMAQPWRLLARQRAAWLYRDWMRVMLMTMLLPWSPWLWRRSAARNARRETNRPLQDALASRLPQNVVVATYGFRFLVAPLLLAMGCQWQLGVAAGPAGAPRLRRIGKARAVADLVGAVALRGALLITDSIDDQDFVQICGKILLMKTPAPAHKPATATGYLPFRYLQNCKRKGENSLIRIVLYYDLFALFLAFVPTSPQPLLCAAGLVLFQISFWTIYEIGYWENDVLGAQYEDAPRIPQEFAHWRARFRPRQAWAWALAMAAPAAIALQIAFAPAAALLTRDRLPHIGAIFGLLCLYLAVSRGLYYLYNRTDPKSRIFLYPLLQITKALGLVAIFPAATAGVLLLASIVLIRQMIYVAYRYSKSRDIFAMPANLHTALCFCFLAAIVLVLNGPQSASFWWLSAIVVAWHLQRARHEITGCIRAFVWLPSKSRRPAAASPD